MTATKCELLLSEQLDTLRLEIDTAAFNLDGPPHEALYIIAELKDAQVLLDVAMRVAIAVCRERKLTWEDIAEHLEVSRQAAWEKFHDRVRS